MHKCAGNWTCHHQESWPSHATRNQNVHALGMMSMQYQSADGCFKVAQSRNQCRMHQKLPQGFGGVFPLIWWSLWGGIPAHLFWFPLNSTILKVLQTCLKSSGSESVDFLDQIWMCTDDSLFVATLQTLPKSTSPPAHCAFSSHPDNWKN
jgi:hypothetical protein